MVTASMYVASNPGARYIHTIHSLGGFHSIQISSDIIAFHVYFDSSL